MKDLLAELLRRAANRLNPEPESTDIVTDPLAWPPIAPYISYPVQSAQCPNCGQWFTGSHACHTVAPIPWPGTTWTVTN